jgi:hypothetical protein
MEGKDLVDANQSISHFQYVFINNEPTAAVFPIPRNINTNIIIVNRSSEDASRLFEFG